ncbi:MAG: nucleoside phosphorylase [Anaerolineaceae bacterium]|nr:nucleoside phosphorylase [Anaerolineaceae bacterium]
MVNINSPTKDVSAPVLTAVSRLQHLRLPKPPTILIFCPQAAVLHHAVKRWRGRRVPGFFGEVYLLGKTNNRVAVAGQFGVGAPVIGVLVEEFAAWGVEKLLLLGIAGGLQPSLGCGDLVLVETAVRDEGTSHHYLPPAPTVAASPALVDWVETAVHPTHLPLKKGATWTTDAPYRETAAAVAHYQQQGVQTVEMETAALFAVAQHCQVQAAALLAVSDLLAGGVWQPASDPKLPERYLAQALDAVMEKFSDDRRTER